MCLTLALIPALGSASSGQQPPAPQTGAPRQLWPQRPVVLRPLAVEAPPDAPSREAAQTQVDGPEFVPGEVLVQFDPDVPEDVRAAARAAARAALATTLRPDGRLERLTTSLPVADAIAILQAQPQVEVAEPNWIVRHQAVSNDPYYTNGSLWGMYGEATTPANEFGSQAGEAWASGLTGSNSVYVVVIDEGIDVSHPDLAPNIWTNPFDPVNGLDDDGNGRIDDVHGWDFYENNNTVYDGSPANPGIDSHGTHVAGTIGARGGNGIGVAGVNWNVTIISAKFLAPNGRGSTDAAILALDYVIDLKRRHGLNIIATNNSWSGGGYSTFLHQAIIRAAKQEILFIAAAGNGGADGDDIDIVPTYPASYTTLLSAGTENAAGYEAVIAVASLTSTGTRWSFSNYGAASVDIGAPGSDVVSTWPQGGYRSLSGTSVATPHVTGAAALYKSAHPAASAGLIRTAILGLGIPTASMSGITTTGRRLNVGEFSVDRHLSISDARRVEGHAGTANAVFTVSLAASSAAPVSVRYTTADITASSGTTAANPTAIAIPSLGAATPYPSTVAVPAGFGTVVGVRVAISGFNHTWPDDVDILLVGPAGQTTILMSDAGGSVDAVNVSLTFDDSGPALPDSGGINSGTFRPTNVGAADAFAAPAPAGPYSALLSAFNGTDAEGTWSLFVVDDAGGESGSIAGGWSLQLKTTAGVDYEASSGLVTIPAGATTATLSVPVVGDLVIEPSETFSVSLFDAAGAGIADAEGIGTIVNDDFTDLSLTGQPIRTVHIVELRNAINDARVGWGLAPFAFSDPSLSAQSSTVRAIHIVELRAALDEAYAEAQISPPIYTDQALTPGVTTIKAAHVAEIRTALVNLQ